MFRFRKDPKNFTKMVLKEKYEHYENALLNLNLESLESRRKYLCEKFAKSGIKYNKLQDLFPENNKYRKMETKDQEKYTVRFANKNRLKNSSIVTMQNYLNEDEKRRKTNFG